MRKLFWLGGCVAVACFPVAAALAGPSASHEQARVLAAAVYGPAAAAYLGFCPQPLLVWLVAWVGMRHLAAPLMAAALHALSSEEQSARARLTWVPGLLVGFSALCFAGAWSVALAVPSRRLASRWAIEVASQSVACALPLISCTLMVALLLRRQLWQRRIAIALLVGLSMVLCATLPGRQPWPWVPGVLDAALARGAHGLVSLQALLWASLPLAAAYVSRRRALAFSSGGSSS